MVEDDLRRLRAAGIGNLNIDLIAGLAHQTLASWEESLDALLEAGAPHASVYMLEVDEDSRLGRELLGGGARYGAGLVPGDDAIARMYERAIETAGAGRRDLAQYEISNFSRPGCESRHNLRYWQRRPYLGVGLDASSALRAADPSPEEMPWVLRATTSDDLNAYLAGPQAAETAWLSPERQHEEAWFLGLRLNAGVAGCAGAGIRQRARGCRQWRRHNGSAPMGCCTFDAGTFRLTARGRMLVERCVSGISGRVRSLMRGSRPVSHKRRRCGHRGAYHASNFSPETEERNVTGAGAGCWPSKVWIDSGPACLAHASACSASRNTTTGERP